MQIKQKLNICLHFLSAICLHFDLQVHALNPALELLFLGVAEHCSCEIFFLNSFLVSHLFDDAKKNVAEIPF